MNKHLSLKPTTLIGILIVIIIVGLVIYFTPNFISDTTSSNSKNLAQQKADPLMVCNILSDAKASEILEFTVQSHISESSSKPQCTYSHDTEDENFGTYFYLYDYANHPAETTKDFYLQDEFIEYEIRDIDEIQEGAFIATSRDEILLFFKVNDTPYALAPNSTPEALLLINHDYLIRFAGAALEEIPATIGN